MSFIQKTAYVADDGYVIDPFRDEDAHAIACSFRAVYGDHYPSPAVYDPASFAQANRSGATRSFVARDPLGAVVGHIALVASTPYRGAREIGQGIVLPGHRGAGLFNRLIAHAVAEAAADPECSAVFAAAVCNHVFSQRALLAAGLTEMAFEVDFAPAQVFAKEKSARGRVATVLQYRPLRRPAWLPAYLPERYADTIETLFAAAGDHRHFLRPARQLALQSQVRFELSDLPGFETTRMVVRHAGRDLVRAAREVERQAAAQGRAVMQIALDLGSPTVGQAVEMLHAQGYWFGGVLPRWFDTDALLLQKTFAEPHFSGIKVDTDHARSLLLTVEADRLAALHSAGGVPCANDNEPVGMPDDVAQQVVRF